MKNFKYIFLAITVIGIQSLQAQGPETNICLVTVDETFSHNIIIWERNDQTSIDPIDSIRIYRKDPQGVFQHLANVHFDALSEYHDLTANVNSSAHTYRLRGVDENGVVGEFSDSATTIHLSLVDDMVNNFLTLEWTNYEGPNQFSFYQCWELDGVGSKVNINNTSSMAQVEWDYTSVLTGTLYDIVVDTDETTTLCTSTARAGYNNTRSNKASSVFGESNNDNSSIKEYNLNNIKFYPNPTEGKAVLEFNTSEFNEVHISLYDLSGKLVKELYQIKALGNIKLDVDIEELDRGMYNLVINNGKIYNHRFIKN